MRQMLIFLMATACAPLAAADPALVPCGADALQDAVGLPLSEVTLPSGRTARIIRPGDAVTMDFSETRLNIELDGEGRVQRVRCG